MDANECSSLKSMQNSVMSEAMSGAIQIAIKRNAIRNQGRPNSIIFQAAPDPSDKGTAKAVPTSLRVIGHSIFLGMKISYSLISNY